MYIILIHGRQVHEALRSCSHEDYVYDELLADLPWRAPPKVKFEDCLSVMFVCAFVCVLVCNYM